MAERKGRMPEWLLEHFDRMILGAVLLVGGLYLYFGVVAAKPPAAFSTSRSVIRDVQEHLQEAHDRNRPKSPANLPARTVSSWTTAIGGFEAKPWASSLMTHLLKDVQREKDYLTKLRKQNTRWELPQIRLLKPDVKIDRVLIRWQVERPPREEWKEGGPAPEDTRWFRINVYKEFVLERKVGSDPNAPWKKIDMATPVVKKIKKEDGGKEKEPDRDVMDYLHVYTYEDRDLKPKTVYAYRVRGKAQAVPYGKVLTQERSASPVTAKTLDIWRVELKWIIAAPGKPPKATLRVYKFDLSRGKWFGPREFDHLEADPYNEIGVVAKINPDGTVDRKSVFREKDPESAEEVEVDWNTGFKIVKLEPNLKREFRKRKVDAKGNPVKDKEGKEIIRTVELRTQRLIYVDDEGKRREVWTKDPNRIIDEGPRPPRKKEKSKKEKTKRSRPRGGG